MALQTVDVVTVADLSNPTELVSYFNNHPLIIVTSILLVDSTFYVIHT